MTTALTVGVDVGGTKIAAGVVDRDGRVQSRRQVASPAHSTPALVEAICGLITDLVADVAGVAGPQRQVGAVGLSVAGFVDVSAGTVVTAPNLAWRDLPLRSLVAERTGLPTVVDNDGNAAAWGEHVFGAGRGVEEMVFVGVGTGLGGGIISAGRLRRGAHGMAAEIGHIGFVPGGEPCGCGRRGCWEQYASGTALARMAAEYRSSRAAAEGGPVSRPLESSPPTGPELLTLATTGDPEATRLFQTLGRNLGTGIASLVAVLDPALVVIGGGVAAAGDVLLDAAREALRADLPGGTRPAPAIVPAALGADAGLIGAAHLALQMETARVETARETPREVRR